MKNAVLLSESIIFYSFGALRYLPVLSILIVTDYILALYLGSSKSGHNGKRIILVLSIVINLAPLMIFKYGTYLSDLLASIGRGDFEMPDIIPLGVSYATFKSISYLCDVYKGKCRPEKNPVDYAAYVLMYQQIIVGPIIRYIDIKDALKQKGSRFETGRCAEGIRQFVYGLAKKVVLADSLGLMWQEIAAENGMDLSLASSGLAWFAVLSFSLQLYLDFSGYSDMSNGLSKIMGFECRENFDYPYCADSFSLFWRKWHITLTEWFRDYIYIPLGGNRKGIFRQIINMFIVWILTGIWHGSTANFLIWGVYCFIILVVEKYILAGVLKKKYAGRLFTIAAAVIGWAVFASHGRVNLTVLLKRMFSFSGGISALYYIRNYGIIFILALLVSGGIYRYLKKTLLRNVRIENAVSLLLIFVCFAYVVGNTNNAALYAVF
ncbi:MAG: MBOAT family protein [Lachnospiraceae bacterium]|nr:MBOAT family protein [Lachnospiraceae bacterium]